jgi:hypothetical protein
VTAVTTLPPDLLVSFECHDGAGGTRSGTLTVAELAERPGTCQASFAGMTGDAPDGTAVAGKPGIRFGIPWHASFAGTGFEDLRREMTALAPRLAGEIGAVKAAVWEFPVTDILFWWWLEPLPEDGGGDLD